MLDPEVHEPEVPALLDPEVADPEPPDPEPLEVPLRPPELCVGVPLALQAVTQRARKAVMKVEGFVVGFQERFIDFSFENRHAYQKDPH